MKAMLSGICAIVVIGFSSYFILNEIGFSAKEAYAGDSVRLD